jgi:hypothetical protein
VIDKYYSIQNTPVINARLAVGLGKVGLKARHLRVAQPEGVRHVTARFSSDEVRRQTGMNES